MNGVKTGTERTIIRKVPRMTLKDLLNRQQREYHGEKEKNTELFEEALGILALPTADLPAVTTARPIGVLTFMAFGLFVWFQRINFTLSFSTIFILLNLYLQAIHHLYTTLTNDGF